MNLLESRL